MKNNNTHGLVCVIGLALLCSAFPALAESSTEHVGWFSLAPALVAIGLAIWLRHVIPALFIGLWLGAWGVAGLDLSGLWTGLLDTFRKYVLGAVANPDHASVILFSIMIGGLVGVVARNGGARGIAEALSKWATSRQRGQLSTVALGVIVFVDDYANTLVVGSTMRPVTDRLKISREKLAYLVDSTAAPVSAVAIVTTWIGYQVGLIDEALKVNAVPDLSAYGVFLSSLPYSFYPLLALVLVVWVAASGRDFGPMATAEARARAEPDTVRPVEDGSGTEAPAQAANAVLPLIVLIGAVLASLYSSGEGDTLREIIGSADAYGALLTGSLLAVLVAFLLPLIQRASTLGALTDAWLEGASSMMLPMVILVLAWSLSGVSGELGTAKFLVASLGDKFPGALLPGTVFLLAGATAFATGTSWGTMGILIPLVVPLALSLGAEPQSMSLLMPSVAAVLAGAVFGDHCSPISDTTILSSMSSGCDHVEHVRTQAPYAALAAAVALFLGYLPAGFGAPGWLLLPIATGALIAAAHWLSRRPA